MMVDGWLDTLDLSGSDFGAPTAAGTIPDRVRIKRLAAALDVRTRVSVELEIAASKQDPIEHVDAMNRAFERAAERVHDLRTQRSIR